MMDTLKRYRNWAIGLSAGMALLGLVLILWPETSAITVCWLLGALCLALGSLMAREVMHLLTPVQQMIGASRDISQGSYDTPDVPVPRQDEMGQLADAFNRMKHSMAEQVNTLREKNEIERELHRQKTEALELQNRMERSSCAARSTRISFSTPSTSFCRRQA